MSELEQFHFLRPYWLLALIPLVVLLWFMLNKRLGSRRWEAVCDAALLPHVLIGRASDTKGLSAFLTALGGGIAIVALAGPVWERLPQPLFTQQGALLIALDLSRAMDADDIVPSRIARARYKIEDLLRQRTEGQTALLVYAGDAFTVSPLTDDVKTIISQLKALTTDIMPVMGNRSDRALLRGMDLLKQAGIARGDILLVSNQVNYQQDRQAVAEITAAGYRLSIIGVGTTSGVPVPLADGSFLKDARGRIVIPSLDEQAMRDLVQLGSGRYMRLSVGDEDIDALQKLFATQIAQDAIADTELETDLWLERGPWLLLVLLPLGLLVFRRGYLVLWLIILLPLPEQVQAFEWQDLWWRADQQARQALDAGDVARAATLFKDPAWKGAAHYRAGDFEAARGALANLQGIDERYNRGNALARLGRYAEAIAEYEKVLADQAGHDDARYNKELLEQALQQQQEQEQEEDQQSRKGGEQEQGEKEQQGRAGQTEQRQAEKQGEQQLREAQMTPDEEQQATEQWLRRIPDDPAGLLRRKFRYQYQQRQAESGDKT